MNKKYSAPAFTSDISSAWRSSGEYACRDSGAELISAPFRCAVLPEMFNATQLQSVKQAVLQLKFNHKSNDLYDFYQSDDLTKSTNPAITKLKDTLTSLTFLAKITDITGIPLIPSKIDLSAHIYPKGGHLLCHDDDIGESAAISRRIAFIIYLVDDDWSDNDGGQLQLFDTDERNYPKDIVRSIVPQFNSFAFFEVFPCSYHQVQEVFKRDRVSISGWLHGRKPDLKSIQASHLVLPMSLPSRIECEESVEDLSKWINPTYLNAATIASINSTFCDESCIELGDFLLRHQFKRVFQALQDTQPSQHGPVNVRHHSVYTPTQGVLSEFMRMLTSSAFKTWLTSVTEMDLVTCISNKLREFNAGDYTLLQDLCVDPVGLDVNLCLNGGSEWRSEAGGQIVYVSGSETLITIEPRANTLNLVCRDEATLRFVKYVNRSLKEARIDVDMMWTE